MRSMRANGESKDPGQIEQKDQVLHEPPEEIAERLTDQIGVNLWRWASTTRPVSTMHEFKNPSMRPRGASAWHERPQWIEEAVSPILYATRVRHPYAAAR